MKSKRNKKLTSRISLTLLTVLLLVLSNSQLSNAGPICVHCNLEIKGSAFVTADQKTYHTDHFLCVRCDQPIHASQFFVVDGKQYDSLCYVTHVTGSCGYCNKPITGKYYTENGLKYHSDCMLDHVVPRCLVCDVPLIKAHYSDGMNNYVCEQDLLSVDNCHSCQRFVKEGKTEGLGRFNDGRFACAQCLSTAVVDLKQAERLMRDIRRELAGIGIEITAQARLELVDVEQLRRQSEGFANDPLGVTLYRRETIMGGLISFKDFRVLVLAGLPEAHLRSVLAHELMHVWMFFNAGDDHEPLLCEGSCEYAAYRILLNDKSESGQFYLSHLLANDDPTYGQGFLQVKDLVNRLGIDGWLEYLKINRTGPWQASADY